MFSVDSNGGFDTLVPLFTFTVKGNLPDNWNVKNIRSTDDGYSKLAITVYPLDASASDTETNNIQDNSSKNYDAGILVLPESYCNEGKPTRLIIYCHGAGVNYGDSETTRFPNTDCLPEFWLSEGYAVMDMDGECGVSS